MKFKIGDKVKRINSNNNASQGMTFKVGEVGIITGFDVAEGFPWDWPIVNGFHQDPVNLELVEEPTQVSVPNQGFQFGDIVEAFGVIGRVSGIKHGGCFITEPDYKIQVTSGDNEFTRFDYYTMDGRAQEWHKIPSLKLIERPLPKEITFDTKVSGSDHGFINNENLDKFIGKKVSVTIKVLEDK